MGIDNRYFSDIIEAVNIHISTSNTNRKVLCLGYPDFLVEEEYLISIFGNKIVKNIPEDPMSNEIRLWHQPSVVKIFDPIRIFKHLGFETTIFDIIAHRKCETLVDLNEPIASLYLEQFDLVIDTGTLEHCFNVGQAFKNICSVVKKDGVFITAAPVNNLNHGYWNFGTITHADGFTQNGFEILKTTYTNGKSQVLAPKSITRKHIPIKTAVTIMAKRVEIKDWSWPTQGKYL